MPASFSSGQYQALEQRQRLGQRGQAAVRILGLSFEEAEAMIEAEALSNPVLRPMTRALGSPVSDVLENTVASEIGLIDHLTSQLAQNAALEPDIGAKAQYLIGCLDEPGYLREAPDWIETEDGQLALQALQGLEPAGIGARDLCECFALQLERSGERSPIWADLLSRSDLIEKQAFDELARQLAISMSELRERLVMLRSLDPAPGHAFHRPAPVMPPDLVVRTSDTGELSVDLTRDRQIRVGVDRDAIAALRKIEHDPQHAAYVKDQLSHARWVRHICRQRSDTLLRVARYAVAFQHEAVMRGLGHVRPLTLRAAADFLDVHESTVSRAVAHKAIETPVGVIALRALFSGVTADGAASVTSVRQRIQSILDTEAPGEVFADEAIAAQLSAQGLRLSRRCIAKHRKAMGVAGARVRRRRLALFAGA